MSTSESKLWKPLKMGNITLPHRIAFAPCTRVRNSIDHNPVDMMTQYYADRASVPGTLIITEATGVSKSAEAMPYTPAIYTAEQVEGWKRIYDAVHAKGSHIFQQLWDLGRAGDPDYLKSRGCKYSSSGDKQLEGKDIPPEPLTEEEIWQKIAEFRAAARAVVDAGGDGVEIHGAHGYLIDQFISENVNNRTDKWGGSVENRARFLLEIVKAVVEEIGAEKTAIRFSPFATYQGGYSSNTWEQYGYIISELKKAGYELAYISLVEPRGNPAILDAGLKKESDQVNPFGDKQSLDFILEAWDNQSPIIVAGGYVLDNVYQAIDQQYGKWDVIVAFGRPFLANPDLVFRVKNGIPFAPYKREFFYTPMTNEGYNDYPFSEEFVDGKSPAVNGTFTDGAKVESVKA